MFESATLTAAPASTRLWSTCAGVTGQILIVGCMLLAPLVSPAVLPNLRSYVMLEPPGPPPGPPPKAPTSVQPRPVKATRVYCPLCEPRTVPREIAIVKDEPMPTVPSGPGVIGGDPNGVATGAGGNLLTGIIGGIPAPAPPRTVVDKPPDVVKPAPAPPKRYAIGGLVKLAAPVFHPDPVYPQIARTARVEGVVVLEGVIGIDGRIHELKVKSGHPFLVKAALDAVSTWVYTPATLNGNLVEVIAPITITFRLGGR